MRGSRRLLLEIKAGARGTRYAGIEEEVLAVLDRHEMLPATIVMAFEADTWRRVRALRPEALAGALSSARRSGDSARTVLATARAAGVGFVGLEKSLVDSTVIAQAREAGVLLGVWTVNEPNAMRRLIDHEVPILITDRPDLAKELVSQRRMK